MVITLTNITVRDLRLGKHNVLLGMLITMGKLGAETLALVPVGKCCNEDNCSVDCVALRIPIVSLGVELLALGEIHHVAGHDMPDVMVTRVTTKFALGNSETKEILQLAEAVYLNAKAEILRTYAKRRAARGAARAAANN